MKFWNIIFSSFFSLFIIHQNAHADWLLGSKWAQNNPGLLPYDACIISYDPPYMKAKKVQKLQRKGSTRNWFEARKFNITYAYSPQMLSVGSKLGVGVDSSPGEAYIYCTSRLLNLTFSLPIKIGKQTSAGIMVNPFSIQKNNIDVTDLDGKTYGEVMGQYHGGQFGVTELIGGSFNVSRNKAGVVIQTRKIMAGVGIEIGATKYEVKIPESIPQENCIAYHTIISKTDQPRELSDCMEEIVPVRVEDLAELKFVKITRENINEYGIY